LRASSKRKQLKGAPQCQLSPRNFFRQLSSTQPRDVTAAEAAIACHIPPRALHAGALHACDDSAQAAAAPKPKVENSTPRMHNSTKDLPELCATIDHHLREVFDFGARMADAVDQV
jgi:hypothetical protein